MRPCCNWCSLPTHHPPPHSPSPALMCKSPLRRPKPHTGASQVSFEEKKNISQLHGLVETRLYSMAPPLQHVPDGTRTCCAPPAAKLDRHFAYPRVSAGNPSSTLNDCRPERKRQRDRETETETTLLPSTPET